jgi:hypothetical protein
MPLRSAHAHHYLCVSQCLSGCVSTSVLPFQSARVRVISVFLTLVIGRNFLAAANVERMRSRFISFHFFSFHLVGGVPSFHFISFVKRILMSINEVVREWCLFIFLRHTREATWKGRRLIEGNKQA